MKATNKRAKRRGKTLTLLNDPKIGLKTLSNCAVFVKEHHLVVLAVKLIFKTGSLPGGQIRKHVAQAVLLADAFSL